jgi:hypothetical protein
MWVALSTELPLRWHLTFHTESRASCLDINLDRSYLVYDDNDDGDSREGLIPEWFRIQKSLGKCCGIRDLRRLCFTLTVCFNAR